jgi:hypothetical protein
MASMVSLASTNFDRSNAVVIAQLHGAFNPSDGQLVFDNEGRRAQ